MNKNIGTADRLARLIIGLVLTAGGGFLFTISPVLGVITMLGGLFCVYEAAVGWCALYALLGKNTCPIKGPS